MSKFGWERSFHFLELRERITIGDFFPIQMKHNLDSKLDFNENYE